MKILSVMAEIQISQLNSAYNLAKHGNIAVSTTNHRMTTVQYVVHYIWIEFDDHVSQHKYYEFCEPKKLEWLFG